MVSSYVINSRGEKELFSFKKAYDSARRVGASRSLAGEIAETVKKEVFPGIKTSAIHGKIRKLLSRNVFNSALRFSLKSGMRQLGPTGFPFEKYIGEVLRESGFRVKINQFLPGLCIRSYEIDFVAERNKTVYVGECKYRNVAGERVHSGDVLENYARFLDISKGPYFKSKKYQDFRVKTMMVTNTKFTQRSVDYSRCVGIDLLGWRIPKNRGLEYLIEKEKVYPITVLPSLRGHLKDVFVSERMMLAKDVLKIEPRKFARRFRVPVKPIESLVREAKVLLE